MKFCHMHSINFDLAIRCHTCHNFTFCCVSDNRHNHLFVLLMLVWESLFMVVFAVNLLISNRCCINLPLEIQTVMSACIGNILYNVNYRVIFILSASLVKCSESDCCDILNKVTLYKFQAQILLEQEASFAVYISGLSLPTKSALPCEGCPPSPHGTRYP